MLDIFISRVDQVYELSYLLNMKQNKFIQCLITRKQIMRAAI